MPRHDPTPRSGVGSCLRPGSTESRGCVDPGGVRRLGEYQVVRGVLDGSVQRCGHDRADCRRGLGYARGAGRDIDQLARVGRAAGCVRSIDVLRCTRMGSLTSAWHLVVCSGPFSKGARQAAVPARQRDQQRARAKGLRANLVRLTAGLIRPPTTSSAPLTAGERVDRHAGAPAPSH